MCSPFLCRRIFSPSRVAFYLVLFSSVWSFGEDDAEPVAEPRYTRVLVTVPVSAPTLEGRQAALAAAHAEAVNLWLESEVATLDSGTRAYFYDHVGEYVLSSDVLQETTKARGGEFEVEVYLNGDRMRYDAASILFPLRAIRSTAVILMGQETSVAPYTTRQDASAAAMLRKLFSDTGFTLITESELNAVYTHDELLGVIRGGDQAVAKLARALRVDVAVLGEARTGVVEGGLGPGKIQSFVDVMVVRSSDGQLLDRVQAEAIVSGEDGEVVSRVAIEDAIYKVQQRVLVAAALGVLNGSTSQWTHCTIQGENVKRISGEIVDYLKSKSTIDKVELLHRERDALILSLAYSAQTSELVDALSLQPGEPFWLDPVKIVDGEMVFTLRAAQ